MDQEDKDKYPFLASNLYLQNQNKLIMIKQSLRSIASQASTSQLIQNSNLIKGGNSSADQADLDPELGTIIDDGD